MDYERLKTDSQQANHAFPSYLKALAAVSPKQFDSFSRDRQMAFLINAYNALTVKLILDHYPVASIKQIGGLLGNPWRIEFFSLLGGQMKSIHALGYEFLRPVYQDVRIHGALNCASISCPSLRAEAFVASRLNRQLNQQMRTWLANPDKNVFDAQRGRVKVSKIFDWYQDDFVAWGGGVAQVLQEYGPKDAQALLSQPRRITFLPYNWRLNDVKQAQYKTRRTQADNLSPRGR